MMKEVDIQALVDANLLQDQEFINWRKACGNP